MEICPKIGLIINRREFKTMTRRVLFVVVLIVAMLALAGCQTVQGIGGDIQWMGKATADAIDGGME